MFFASIAVLVIIGVKIYGMTGKKTGLGWAELKAMYNQTRRKPDTPPSDDGQETGRPSDSDRKAAIDKLCRDTFGLMFHTLKSIGCQPEACEDGSLSVDYQGENFQIKFDRRYAEIWDLGWGGVKADDPELGKIREAVNIVNYNFSPTVVLTVPNEEGMIALHSHQTIMLHPACPENAAFVEGILNSFFTVKENVSQNYQLINAQQAEAQKKRRPIGFTASRTSQTGEQ